MTSSVSGIHAIPDHLFWLIGKGRQQPSEPLYAIQIIDPESGVVIAEREGETLDIAIAAALADLKKDAS